MINRLSKSKVKSGKSSPSASQPASASRITTQLEQLHSNDWATRSTAALELGKLGDRQATKALSAALRDPAAEVARQAAAALGALRDVSAIEALSAVVVNADGYFDGSVRVAAAEALGNLQDRRAVAALITVVRDQTAEVSQAAIRALGLLGDERAIDLLVTVVRNTDNYFLPFVRQTAVEALTHLSVPSAKESLRRIAADSRLDASVRQAAGSALTIANSIN
jgi:HEAT repeat protein